jgi:hypothetical protein
VTVIADEIQDQADHIARAAWYQQNGTGGSRSSRLAQIQMPIVFGSSAESPARRSGGLPIPTPGRSHRDASADGTRGGTPLEAPAADLPTRLTVGSVEARKPRDAGPSADNAPVTGSSSFDVNTNPGHCGVSCRDSSIRMLAERGSTPFWAPPNGRTMVTNRPFRIRRRT